MSSQQPQAHLAELLTQILGVSLSETDLAACLAATEIREPRLAELFWRSNNTNSGVYIVLAGKVRLLDSSDDLIVTFSPGNSFGELTLFPEAEFQPYHARASANLKLCYLNGDVIQTLINGYPTIREQLYRRAEIWDLLMLCCQNSQFPRLPAAEILLGILSRFQRHDLEVGSLPSQFLQDTNLWLLRWGELLHSDGQTLTPGKIFSPSRRRSGWQAIQPTIAYSLSDSEWQAVLRQFPRFTEFITSQPMDQRHGGEDPDEDFFNSAEESPGFLHYRSPSAFSTDSSLNGSQNGFRRSKQNSRRPKHQASFPKGAPAYWWRRLTRRYPIFEQQSASDCGAACLVMVSRYWGKRFGLNRLRDLTNPSRSGASMRSLAAAAETIGFATRPVKASFDKLTQQPLPAIAHWEGKHYVVVYEITRTRVIVGDPAVGQRILTPAEFRANWTGYALLLQPTPLLKEAQENGSSFWKFFELVKPHWLALLEVFIASVFIQIFGLVTPLLTQLLLDRVIVQRSTVTLTAVGLGLLIFALFRVAMTGLRQYILDHTANRVSVSMIVGFIKHTFRLPLSFLSLATWAILSPECRRIIRFKGFSLVNHCLFF